MPLYDILDQADMLPAHLLLVFRLLEQFYLRLVVFHVVNHICVTSKVSTCFED